MIDYGEGLQAKKIELHYSVRFKDGWGYRVEMPERIDNDRFMRVAVRVILSETANREALAREAELPPWLAEGLAAELQSTVLSTLALEPETQLIQRDLRPRSAARCPRGSPPPPRPAV